MEHSAEDDFLSRAEKHFRDRGYQRTAGRLKILRKLKGRVEVDAASLIAPVIDDAVASETFRSMQNGTRNARPLLEEAVSTSMMVQSSLLVPSLTSADLLRVSEEYMKHPVGSDRLDHLWIVYDPSVDDTSAALGAIPLLINTYNEVWKPVRDLFHDLLNVPDEMLERMLSIGSAVETGGVRSDFGYVYDRCVSMKDVDAAGGRIIAGEVSVPANEFILWPRIMEIVASILMDILICVAAKNLVMNRL